MSNEGIVFEELDLLEEIKNYKFDYKKAEVDDHMMVDVCEIIRAVKGIYESGHYETLHALSNIAQVIDAAYTYMDRNRG